MLPNYHNSFGSLVIFFLSRRVIRKMIIKRALIPLKGLEVIFAKRCGLLWLHKGSARWEFSLSFLMTWFGGFVVPNTDYKSAPVMEPMPVTSRNFVYYKIGL